MVFEKKETAATMAMYGMVKFPVMSRNKRLIQNPEQREQENGFGMETLNLSSFDSPDSRDWMNPDRSMMKHRIACMSNMFMTIITCFL